MTSSSSQRTADVSKSDAGLRLDKFLAASLQDVSRARIQSLIQSGHVCLLAGDGTAKSGRARKTIEDTSYTVKPGEHFQIDLPPVQPAKPRGQAIPLDIAYEDDDLIVIAKPAGLVMHPAPGNAENTLVNALIAHCGDSLSGIGGERRPGIVHRLDKDTSGLVVVAKNDAAHQGLSRQFSEHSIERAYQAIVWGAPRPAAGLISGDIGRSPQNRMKMALVKKGRPARTRYRVIETFGARADKGSDAAAWASLVECRLETGRTHQIRVHMSSINHPLIGDPAYGRGRRLMPQSAPENLRDAVFAFSRQALHAWLLGFTHPISGKDMSFEQALPADMQALLALFRSA